MGVVYLAKDTALECLVAVKFLPRHATLDANAVRRFRREAQRVAQLRHPSIVAIHRLDTLDVCPYFVMDYVNGHDLAQEILVQRGEAPTFSPILPLGEGKRSQAAAASLIAAVADALGTAHSAGIVHRDVKPNNILLDQKAHPFLADFGIARDENFGTTNPGGPPVGTVQYMSPEQARASLDHIDHRTDIYSLGVVLYELLTLKRPFEGKTKDAILTRILNDEVKRPSRVKPGIHPTLDTICLKAMAKSPNDRYSSAAAFRDDLLAFLRGEDVHPGSTAWWSRVRRRLIANQKMVVSAAVILLLAVAALGAWRSFDPTDDEIRSKSAINLALSPDTPPSSGATTALFRVNPITCELGLVTRIEEFPARVNDLDPGQYRIITQLTPDRWQSLDRDLNLGPAQDVVIPWPASTDPTPGGMVLVAGGSFLPPAFGGSHPDITAPVAVPSFYMDAYEVSNGEWEAFCRATNRDTPLLWNEAQPGERDERWSKLPVVQVSATAARAFAEWSGKRLPTMIEWIWAAMGSELAETPWRSDRPPEEVDAVVGAQRLPPRSEPRAKFLHYLASTRPVDSSLNARTPTGIHHLYGNVSEWTETAAHVKGLDLSRRIVLGGNYDLPKMNLPVYGSSGTGEADASLAVGFRCVRSVK
jgi:serine/threonine protein kinase